MLLALDIGNTNITLGVFAAEALLHTFRAESRRERTPDECAALLVQLLALRGIAPRAISRAVLGSVVPKLTETWVAALGLALGREPLVVTHALDLGITIAVEQPEQVGVDRLINVAAVRASALADLGAPAAGAVLAQGAIVVDLGTATTFDCLSPSGEFVGGVIAPGIAVGLEGLVSRAAQLRSVPLAAPERAVGRSTTECLQSGLVFGYAGLVDGLVERLHAELGFPCVAVATGGLAGVVVPHTRTLQRIEPDLTLHGLRVLHERNTRRS